MNRNLIPILLICCIFPLTCNSITSNLDNIYVSYSASDSLIVKEMIHNFSSDIENFHRSIGQYPDLKINIVVIDSEEEYLRSSLSKSEIIEFSRAFYSRRDSTIYIKDPKDHMNFVQLNKILLHEYIHHFVNNYWHNTPLWFNEGLAVYFSGDLSTDREFNFVKNYILGNSRSLDQMRFHYPKSRIEWESFYAKSGLAVKYLYKQNYREFIALCEMGAKGAEFNNAFLRTFFMTTGDFSLLFEEYSKKHFTTEILLASTGMIWGILPLILIIGYFRKKIIAARIKKNWEQEEKIATELPEIELEMEKETELE
ncbi:hypothetical protein ACFLYK_01490 [Candidatus Cloacimonadota bacterium]